jgi:hypothetical protein
LKKNGKTNKAHEAMRGQKIERRIQEQRKKNNK